MVINGKPVRAGLSAVIIATLLFVLFVYACPQIQAQDATVFSAGDKFTVPEQNGSISFATNGSCSSATLKNGIWTFNELTLNNTGPLGNLKASATNSNVTIYLYFSSTSNLFGRGAFLMYNAQGVGQQVFNLGLNRSTSSVAWSVIVPFPDGTGSDFLAEGKNWEFAPDNTLTINGVVGNVTLVYFNIETPDNSHLPFYLQHSVAIATAVIVAATVAVAAVISFRVRRRKDGGH